MGLCFGWVENIEVPLLLGLSDYIENWVTKIKLGGFLALSLHGDIFPGYIGLLSSVLNCQSGILCGFFQSTQPSHIRNVLDL